MIDRACTRIVDVTGRTAMFVLIVILTILWIGLGGLSRIDPYPFQFLGVVCNVLQLWMIFIIAVGQRGNHHEHRDQHGATRQHTTINAQYIVGEVVKEIRRGRPLIAASLPPERAALDYIHRDLRDSIYELHGQYVKELHARTAPLHDLVQTPTPAKIKRPIARGKH